MNNPKTSRASLFILLLITITAPTMLLARQAADSSLSTLDQTIQSSIADWKVPGAAVSIVSGGSVVYIKGFGVRDIRTKQPVTPDTLFQIGSCTKAFTSALIAMLVDQGKMQWDGKVNGYIPFFHLDDPLADENVKVRDLLTHRTGLPGADLMWYGSDASREELLHRIAYLKPVAGFRTEFIYQNMMFLAAGQSAAEAAGTTWDELIRKRIFEPLGMTSSVTSIADAQKSDNRATPHDQNPDGSPRPLTWHNLDNIAPAGAVISNARDMAKWVSFQLGDGMFDGKRLISQKNMREMHSPQMVVPLDLDPITTVAPQPAQESYGFGWFIEEYRGHHLVLHPGNIDGFAAEVVLIPEIHAGYFVEVNSSGWGLFSNTSLCQQVLTYQIADHLLHLPDADWNARYHKLEAALKAEQKSGEAWQSKRAPGTHPSHELAAYAGEFDNPAYGNAQITLADNQLVLHFHSVSSELNHFEYDTFVADWTFLGKTRLIFSLNEQGNVDKFVIAGIPFQRIKPPAQASESLSELMTSITVGG